MSPEQTRPRGRAVATAHVNGAVLGAPPHAAARVRTDGRFLCDARGTLTVKGVTYGSFASRADGAPFPARPLLAADLAAMARAGLNTVRTYSTPPPDLLDLAGEHGLRVLVGLSFHDWRMERATDRAARRRILAAGRRAVDEAMDLCAGRSEVLAVAVGNEVPADLVRLHGIGAVEDCLAELIARVHGHDADALATYVNYPTTEYLTVEGQDLVGFNVFLEDPAALARYLRHLQVVAGERPLLVTELGLCSAHHGEQRQARSLDAQLRVVAETGCAGATVFAWTDDWVVGGVPVEDWRFGLTTAERRPKRALGAVRRAMRRSVADLRERWPSMSVIVCARNEEEMIAGCLSSLAACEYPALEVIVCDDGSRDRTLAIARQFPFRILELPHGGLSAARNAGIAAAGGELVAFLDADARCHPDWPFHLALSLEQEGVVATGGPNLPVEGAGFVERAVARSPGGPVEVLLTDDRAEHVAGCNMAFRREVLVAVGGFRPCYTAAGDDVDLCWRLLDLGHRIGFAASAQVRHHRRRTVRGYLRQQRGYGRAERMLSGPHAHRFNRLGQARWAGVVYGGAPLLPWLLRPRIYHGPMGIAPFQRVERRRAEVLSGWCAALLPLLAAPALAGAVAALWAPAWLLLPAAVLALLLAYALNVAVALRVDRREPAPVRLRLLVGLLHVLQPIARSWGRLRARPVDAAAAAPSGWSGQRLLWLAELRRSLESQRVKVRVAAPHRPWDFAAELGYCWQARINCGVVWGWEPRHRARYGLHPAVLLPLGGLALLPLPLAGAGGGALVAWIVWDGVRLRRRVRRALAVTTAGARVA